MSSVNWLYKARLTWPMLTVAAGRNETHTYKEVGERICTNPLSVGRALGPIQDCCLDQHFPPLTALVVGASSKKPGMGFIAWDVDDLAEAHRLVYAFDWSVLSNPFREIKPADSIKALSTRVVTDPEAAGEVYAKVRARGVAQQVFRAAMLTAAATLALGALSAAPAEAAARLPLAPETTLAAAEWSATGTRSGAANRASMTTFGFGGS